MELGEVGNYVQTGEGVAWSSLSFLSTKDSRYAYATINGSSRNTSRPKNIILEDVKFNIPSFNPSRQEVYIEYKLYLDEPAVPDGFSLLKRPDILITFYDDSKYLIEHDDYVQDDFRELFLVKNEKIDTTINVNHLSQPFTVEFIFDEYNSNDPTNVTVMMDYVVVKIVELEKDVEVVGWKYHPLSNVTLTIPAGETTGEGQNTITNDIMVGIRAYNKKEDEVFYIMIPNDAEFDDSKGFETQNGYFDSYASLNRCMKFHANLNDEMCYGAFWVKVKRAGMIVVDYTTNYGVEGHLYMNITPPTFDMGNYGEATSLITRKGDNVYHAHIEVPTRHSGNASHSLGNRNYTIRMPSGLSIIPDSVNTRVQFDGDDLTNDYTSDMWYAVNSSYIDAIFSELPEDGRMLSFDFDLTINSNISSADLVYTVPFESEAFTLSTPVIQYIDNSFTRINVVPSSNYMKSGSTGVLWVGGDEYSQFTFSAHYGNYFKFNKPTHQISVGYPIAYIGAVRLHRGHRADVTNSTTNSSSKEVYQNRAYLGKKGDWNEKISMTLRIPWQDVVTLQNHTYHDSPIAIDTCPDLPDGDPLNHRGWAEIYGVNNIKKINDRLYQCEPDVEYLTHELLGKFLVQQLTRICPVDIEYSTNTTHQYWEDIRDVLDLSSYRDFTNLVIDDDSFKGVYTVPSGTTYSFASINPINTISDWSFRWRNILPRIDSNAYDGDNWSMAFRVLNHDSRELLFEYLYYNFKHLNENDMLLNECDVKVTKLNPEGNYDISNYTHMNLDFDDVNASSYLSKANTSIKVQEYVETYERGHNVQFKLVDWNGNPLYDKFVDVNVFDDRGDELQSFTTITNSKGVGEFEFNQDRGVYTIQYKFMGDNDYYESYAESKLYMNIQLNTATLFDITNNQTFTVTGKYFTGRLVTGANAPLLNAKVKIFIKKATTTKWWTPYLKTTNANGEFSLQINLEDGIYDVKTVYEGGNNYDQCSETVKIKVKHGSGTATKIIASDLTVPATDVLNKTYSFDAILQTTDGKPVASQSVVFTFYSYSWKEAKSYTKTTNSKGVASIPINLNSGIYYVDTSYDGVAKKYKPSNSSNKVYVKAGELIATELIMNDLVINDCLHHELGATLKDEYGNLLVNYPVRFELTEKVSKKKIAYTMNTNYEGMAELNINLSTSKWYARAFFDGANRYKATSTAQKEVTVKRPSKQEVVHSIANKYTYGQGEAINFTVRNTNNVALSGIPISIYLYDKNTKTRVNNHIQILSSYSRVSDVAEYETNSNGLLSFIPNVKAGNYILEIHTYCQGNYLSKVSTYDITLQSNQKMSTTITPLWTNSNPFVLNTPPRSQDKAEILLTDSEGNPLAFKKIVYTVGQKKYYKTTNNQGKTYLPINMNPQSIAMSIKFEGDGGYGECTITGTINVNSRYPSLSNIPVINYTKNATITLQDYEIDSNTNTYIQNVRAFPHYSQVLVKDSNNVPLSNQTVSFTIYGENFENNTYYRTTNDNGIATLEFLKHSNNNYPVMVKLESNVYFAPSLTYSFIVDVSEIYDESFVNNSVIDRSETADGLTILETPDPSNYDGAEVGSTLDMFFNNNTLEIHDYGLIQDTSTSSGKISINDIVLPDGVDYDIEVVTSFDSDDNFTEELLGTMQVQVRETLSNSRYKKMYSNLFCSPATIPDYECIFTRDAEDGRMYYYDASTKTSLKRYRLSPFLQYKGGVNLETESGVSLFNLQTSISPIIVENGLVKLAFHKNSGYVYVYRYNYHITGYEDYVDHSEWVLVRILKIKNYDYFNLDEYSLDKIKITFGKSTFTVYRGRPFIVVNHENEDIYFTKQVGRVFCETERNGFVFSQTDDSQVNVEQAEFFTNNAVNLIAGDLHISEDIRPTNFIASNLTISTPYELDNKKAYKVTYTAETDRVIFTTFPRQRMELPSQTVSVLFNRFKTNTSNVVIQLYGYHSSSDSVGTPIITEDINEDILHNGELNQVRVTFNISDADWENYSHYAIGVRLIHPELQDYVMMNQIMLYEGSEEIDYEPDNYEERINNTEIFFENNYYAKLYNKTDDFGLCILRPYLDSLRLFYIPRSKITVLIPYMKHSNFYDTPEMVCVEYLYSKDEITKIQGEDYGI